MTKHTFDFNTFNSQIYNFSFLTSNIQPMPPKKA